MSGLSIYADAEQAFALDPTKPQVLDGTLTDLGLMRHGTSEGKAVVMAIVTLPDGTQVLGQTTWRLFNTAARALAATPIAVEEVND